MAPLMLLQFALKLLKVTLVALPTVGALGVQAVVFRLMVLEFELVAHPL